MALKVSELLTPEQVQRLRGKSDLVGALLVLHAWGLICAQHGAVRVVAQPAHFRAGRDGDRHAPARPRHPDARRRARAAVRQPAAERVGRHLAVRRAGLHQPARSIGPITWRTIATRSRPRIPISACRRRSRSAAGACGARSCRDLTGRTAYQRRLEQFRGGLAKEWRSFAANLVLLGGARRRPATGGSIRCCGWCRSRPGISS